MNHGLLVIFLLASCWLYAAILLALRDRLWNLGRIVQFALCAAAGAWLILTGRLGPAWVLATGLLFAANVFLPAAAQRLIRALLLKGRKRAARTLQLLLSVVTWKSPTAVFGALDRLRALMQSRPAALSRGNYRHLLLSIHAAPSLTAFIAAQIDAHLAFRDPDGAIALFRRHFEPGPLKPAASVLYTMVIPYADTGDLPRAAACLRRAEAMQHALYHHDLRRLIAHLRVLALAGRLSQLEDFLERHRPLAAKLPAAYPLLWHGVALIRSGHHGRGADALAHALARVTPDEAGLRETIERHLAEPAESTGPPDLPPQVLNDLAALEALHRRPAVAAHRLAESPPAAVAPALVAAIVLVWLITELVGSSTDPFTLLRFGANASALVRNGEWWRMVSSIFLHVGWLHIFFNAYACHLFGTYVERATGRWEIFAIFLASGIVGSAASAHLGNYPLSAGASGAVFGLLGAAIVITLRFRHAFPARLRRTYVFNFLFIAAINMIFGLLEPRIDNLAHAGGFAAGTLAAVFIPGSPAHRLRKLAFKIAGPVLLLVLSLAAADTIHNVRTGGYPRRPVPLRQVEAVDRLWRIRVPVFWETENRAKRSALLLDPLGASLRITAGPLGTWRTRLEKDEKLADHHSVRLGPRRYVKITTVLHAGDEQHMRFRYLAVQGDLMHTLTFECLTQDAAAYGPLFERIVADFDITDTLPAPLTRSQEMRANPHFSPYLSSFR